MSPSLSKYRQWLLVGFAAFAAVLALSWQPLVLAVSAAGAEHRPALLEDAKWNRPQSASAFQHRFGNGRSEADLLQWLSGNNFKVNRSMRRAGRMVNGIPCRERIAVKWAAANGIISDSSAVVSEAGCL